jgi:Ala-tRNA(Pro) deacylase
MTCRERLESYLRRQRVPFGIHPHASAYTAHDIAAHGHIAEQMVAKVVVVAADRSFALLVLPAARWLDMQRVATMLNARELRLASEGELADLFPDCELGAMPPFGELYGLPVYVDRSLIHNAVIFFPAGTHTTAMSLSYADFQRLAAPTLAEFTSPYHGQHHAPAAPQRHTADAAVSTAAAPASEPRRAAPPDDYAARPILVPLDGSPFGEHALPMALELARSGSRGITLAHAHSYITPVVTPLGSEIISSQLDGEMREQEARYLQDVTRRLCTVWDGPISQAIVEAPVAAALDRHASKIGAGLIVLTSHGRSGVARAWLGSVADELLRHSAAPILVVRPGEGAPDLGHRPPLHNILIPLDGSSLAEQALDLAMQIGLPTQARYTLLHVVTRPHRSLILGGPELGVDEEAEAWRRATIYLDTVAPQLHKRSLAVIPQVRVGAVAPTILEAVEAYHIDLIVMTTHGRGGVNRMLVGSVADKVLRGANVPVLFYRPPSGER